MSAERALTTTNGVLIIRFKKIHTSCIVLKKGGENQNTSPTKYPVV